MHYSKSALILLTAALLAMGSASAQDNPPHEPKEMSSEERDAAREARREKWENMSEEERTAAREQRRQEKSERRSAMRERWENMSDEEREVARERRSEHKGKRRHDRSRDRRGADRPAADKE